MRLIAMALLFVVCGAVADTEIYRCPLEDGTFAFQETPCPEPEESNADPETVAADEDAADFDNPFDVREEPPPATSPLPENLSTDRAACEKETRDAIDAIDLEMRETAYSEEQGKQYLAELLTLTRQLRACKQLQGHRIGAPLTESGGSRSGHR